MELIQNEINTLNLKRVSLINESYKGLHIVSKSDVFYNEDFVQISNIIKKHNKTYYVTTYKEQLIIRII